MIVCDKKALFYQPVIWVFELIKKAYGIDLIYDPKFVVDIGVDDDSQIQISNAFYVDLIQNGIYDHRHYFNDSPLILVDGARGKAIPDYISSIFYLVNGFQEYQLSKTHMDNYGRLDFKHSLQSRFDVLRKDLVKEYVQMLLFNIDPSLTIPAQKSRIFVSHDIDSVYGSLKYDGLWALKKGNLSEMMKVIIQTVLQNPPWFNIDAIAKLEDELDIKACYYWIVQNGRSKEGIKNGDYRFAQEKIQKQYHTAFQLGNEMGIHKSTLNSTVQEELSEIKNATSCRYHFLKIKNPSSFMEMEESGIQSDSSIGFPYVMGFKNSFGMPYYPYGLEKKDSINVLEIPLHIMDGMFGIQDKKSCENAFLEITQFIEANSTNAIISILWHNSEMTNFAYQWSFKCYKKLLHYFVDCSFETVLPSQLVNEYETA
ncbi:MAG: hypothetical protein AAGA77_25775 [Bacteroidota bacterium]